MKKPKKFKSIHHRIPKLEYRAKIYEQKHQEILCEIQKGHQNINRSKNHGVSLIKQK